MVANYLLIMLEFSLKLQDKSSSSKQI